MDTDAQSMNRTVDSIWMQLITLGEPVLAAIQRASKSARSLPCIGLP